VLSSLSPREGGEVVGFYVSEFSNRVVRMGVRPFCANETVLLVENKTV